MSNRNPTSSYPGQFVPRIQTIPQNQKKKKVKLRSVTDSKLTVVDTVVFHRHIAKRVPYLFNPNIAFKPNVYYNNNTIKYILTTPILS